MFWEVCLPDCWSRLLAWHTDLISFNLAIVSSAYVRCTFRTSRIVVLHTSSSSSSCNMQQITVDDYDCDDEERWLRVALSFAMSSVTLWLPWNLRNACDFCVPCRFMVCPGLALARRYFSFSFPSHLGFYDTSRSSTITIPISSPLCLARTDSSGGKEQQCICCEKQNKNPEKGNLRASLDWWNEAKMKWSRKSSVIVPGWYCHANKQIPLEIQWKKIENGH